MDNSPWEGIEDRETFVSYARVDAERVRVLYDALERHGKKPWVDWEGIHASEEWLKKIQEAIDYAHAFVFVVSRSSIRSEVAVRDELAHALAANKKIIPVLLEDVRPQDAPKELRRHVRALFRIQFISLRVPDELDRAVAEIVEAIESDFAHVRKHTNYLRRCRDWIESGRDPSQLLQDEALDEAERWLSEARSKDPLPNKLHVRFIDASRRARHERWRFAVLTIVVAALGFVAFRWVSFEVAVFLLPLPMCWLARYVQRRDAHRYRATRTGKATTSVLGLAATYLVVCVAILFSVDASMFGIELENDSQRWHASTSGTAATESAPALPAWGGTLNLGNGPGQVVKVAGEIRLADGTKRELTRSSGLTNGSTYFIHVRFDSRSYAAVGRSDDGHAMTLDLFPLRANENDDGVRLRAVLQMNLEHPWNRTIVLALSPLLVVVLLTVMAGRRAASRGMRGTGALRRSLRHLGGPLAVFLVVFFIGFVLFKGVPKTLSDAEESSKTAFRAMDTSRNFELRHMYDPGHWSVEYLGRMSIVNGEDLSSVHLTGMINSVKMDRGIHPPNHDCYTDTEGFALPPLRWHSYLCGTADGVLWAIYRFDDESSDYVGLLTGPLNEEAVWDWHFYDVQAPGVQDGASNFGRIRSFPPGHATQRTCHELSMRHALNIARAIDGGSDEFDVDDVRKHLQEIVELYGASRFAAEARRFLKSPTFKGR